MTTLLVYVVVQYYPWYSFGPTQACMFGTCCFGNLSISTEPYLDEIFHNLFSTEVCLVLILRDQEVRMERGLKEC